MEPYREGLGDLLEVAVVPGGHNIHWDAFDETADAIERFLDSAHEAARPEEHK